jgi:hypothetical protein
MENTKPDISPFRKKPFLILAPVLLLLLIYYAIMAMRAPAHKLSEIKNEYSSLTEKKDLDKKMLTDSAYLSLIKERAFLQSRIIMAGTDSIYLTINLADSTMNLEISGVVVHSTKMKSYTASRILTRGNENIITAMLATPLTIESDLSTIKKEPVMIKMAPKDTSEYKPDIMPDTSITEPVNYILYMTNGIRIYVYQSENEKKEDRKMAFRFDLKDRMDQTWDALRKVAVLKVPDYHPFIKIKVPRADAKIMYRAIPKKGQIAIFL